MQRFVILMTATLLVAGLSAFAQTAQFTGRVSDPSDLGMPGAEVRLRSPQTGIERVLTTNSEGYYSAPLLPRGTYSLTVSHVGFKPVVRAGVLLDEGQVLRLDFALQIGDTVDTVTVRESTPVLEKESSVLSTVISSDKILQLPALNRNIIGLAALSPMVRAVGAFNGLPISSASNGIMSISGGGTGANNYQIDGIAAENTTNGTMSIFLSLEATEQFRVITRNPSAEYGRTGGGVVLMTSKSGTNEFHGSALEFLRNQVMDANAFFANRGGAKLPSSRLNQWGATLGGPLRREKTFFFFNYEGFEFRQANEATRSVPTALERTGNFQETRDRAGRQVMLYDPLTTRAAGTAWVRDAMPMNTIPANRIAATARAILDQVPLPNQAGVAGQNNFYKQVAAAQNKRIYGIKLDHNLNAARRISGRYTKDTSLLQNSDFYGTLAEPNNSRTPLFRHSTALTYTEILRPSLLLELRGGFNSYGALAATRGEGFDITTLGMPASLKAQMQVLQFPQISVSDITGIGMGVSGFRQRDIKHTYGGALTHIVRSHTLKYGGEFRPYQLNNSQRTNVPLSLSFSRGFTQGPNPNTAASNLGSGTASLLLGFPSGGSGTLNADSTYTIRHSALFLQDDWKVTPRLTLNLGLRWEYEGPYTDRFNAITNFDPDKNFSVGGVPLVGGLLFLGQNGIPRGYREVSKGDFQPRFGFAYRLWSKTIVRGGYGLYFLPTTGNTVTLGRSGFDFTSPLVATNAAIQGGFLPVATIADPFPRGLAPAPGGAGGPATGIGTPVTAVARTLRRGSSQQFNFNIQQELPSQVLLEVGYAANRGAGLPGQRAADYLPFAAIENQTVAQLQAARPNPYCGIMHPRLTCNANVSAATLLDTYPQFSGAAVLDTFADSSYHALLIKVERRLSKGLTMLGSYVFSRLMDNHLGNGANVNVNGGSSAIQDWSNLRNERSLSALNLPRRFVATVLYDLPIGQAGPRWMRSIIGGWQVNGILTLQSGEPIGVTTAVGGRPFAGIRPNLVGDPKPAVQSIDRWLDPAAFTVAAERSPGNAPRNLSAIRTDWLKNIEFAMLKNVPLTERIRLQLRGEASNLTNTPSFGNPATGFGAANFGAVTTTRGTPRNIQVAMKLLF